jgi:cytochrome P450
MQHPAAYKTLTKEIDDASAAGQLSYPLIKYHEASRLPYFEACCKEGMRLHPSVGLTVPRHVPTGGCEVAGDFFSAGIRLGVNAAVVHRDTNIFGHDANKFVPERWFREDAVNMERYMFQVSLSRTMKCLATVLTRLPSLALVQGRAWGKMYVHPY